MRSPSAGSVASGSCSGSEGGGKRWTSIRKMVQLMEMVREGGRERVSEGMRERVSEGVRK